MLFSGFRHQVTSGSLMRLEWPKLRIVAKISSSSSSLNVFSALERPLYFTGASVTPCGDRKTSPVHHP